jgi:hypothetical protein
MGFMKWGLYALLLLALIGCARAEPVMPTEVDIPEADALSATEEADAASATEEAGTVLDADASSQDSPAAETDATPEQGARGGQRGGGDLSTPVFITPIAATQAGATPFVMTITPVIVTQQAGGTMTIPDDATLLEVETLESFVDASGRILLNVRGSMVNECRVPFETLQALVGTTIYVRIYQVITEDVRCGRNILRYDEVIPLTVPLTRGEIYTVDVNNTRVQLTAQ